MSNEESEIEELKTQIAFLKTNKQKQEEYLIYCEEEMVKMESDLRLKDSEIKILSTKNRSLVSDLKNLNDLNELIHSKSEFNYEKINKLEKDIKELLEYKNNSFNNEEMQKVLLELEYRNEKYMNLLFKYRNLRNTVVRLSSNI